ncbi:LUD domain-containing protein [Acetobacter sacchari]|uniref:LUD domain-containing protein n=1 Tax=Acetobacter sacchari TaxID=2661687 RepID=A0ABS3M1F1_9PROT|nr:LUD domain-containing protein [Acetobacter sacchari]
MSASSREAIFAAIRANRPKVEAPLPAVPLFDVNAPADLVAAFTKMVETMGGKILEHGEGDPIAALRAAVAGRGVVASAVKELPDDAAQGVRAITPDMAPTSLADVEVSVVRAAFGVAETGSVCLPDSRLIVNTAGFLAQHLIVLLDPTQIVANLHHAYRRPEWRRHAYAVFQTGPSATADIEGVLIHGAQGVRSLRVLFCPET